MRFLNLISFLFIGTASAATNLQFAGLSAQGVIPLSSGKVLVFGSTQQYPNANVIDTAGLIAGTFPALVALGSGDGRILVAALDPGGNVWIAGQTDSDDFPLIHPLFSQKRPYMQTGFVAKLDVNFNILFSTFLGGTSTGLVPGDAGTTPTGITIDKSGNAYITGHTGEAGFPSTGPVLGTGTPGPPPDGTFPLVYTFVTKISADGSKLVYSVFLGGDKTSCPSGVCLQAANTSANSIAVEANGEVTVAGGTTATNFPATPNAYQTECNCGDLASNGFIGRISADASKLIWATYIGTRGGEFVQSIALDTSENVYVIGTTFGGIVMPPGALQPSLPVGGPDGFAAKLSADGTKLLFGTNLGGSLGATLTGFSLDANGNVWVAGNTASADFPGLTNTPASGIDFALELNADDTALQEIFQFVPGTVTQPPTFDSNGNLVLLASGGNLLRLDPKTALTTPGVFSVSNAAVLTASAGVAAGEVATFFGVGLGPPEGIVAVPNADGRYPKHLGGVNIVFETRGISMLAPLLYVGPNQINFQVPFQALGQPNIVTITTPTAVLPPIQMETISTIGVFHQTGSNHAAALNQDLSVNSQANPAKPGSIVTLYTTGLCGGFLEPDGAVSKAGDMPMQEQGIAVTVVGSSFFQPQPVFYFGPAPGIINGVCQLNVQLPLNDNPILIVNEIAVSGPMADSFQFQTSSNAVQIYTQ